MKEHNKSLGTGAMVLQGVTIGNGAVLAAGAVATKDIPLLKCREGCRLILFATEMKRWSIIAGRLRFCVDKELKII